jgi:hypothetical protein
LIDFKNIGGLVMPIIFEVEFDDGSTESIQLPVEIWARNNEQVNHLLLSAKKLKSITLDPRLQTADVDLSNNHFPPQVSKSRFQLFKEQTAPNAMQRSGLGESQ